ncbi:TonB-dependent hemoglobin/transferrin/lactoferrin family receptor [Komagataeibacter saccharivorans]|uniref:TonB-dependent hemoglobin/transferrin/lactoferrin family receptor n=1 Tax=Komagataeibacter saccharivorans TaxID=265959 RepID=UPI000CB9567E|nr:TonB-dependent hemoglobin/transferrin/lactoferrin family receptor [Komagataeibacter saccharivorans]PMP98962.1 Heme/hemopexin utilization protein [Komagataeibacter saccharivorans]
MMIKLFFRRGQARRRHMLATTALACAWMTPAFAASQATDTTTSPKTAVKQSSPPAQVSISPAAPIRLSPVKVQGGTDIIDLMKFDPDKDHSEVGKPAVLTTTTTYKTFRDRQIDSLEDYSRRVDASVNYSNGNSSINIRGLDQNRILTTIDGVRMPWANDGAYAGSFNTAQGGVSDFDFNSLGAIDVVKSADSSFFGTGALGGVIALRTLDPEDILKPGKNFGGLTKMTYNGASEAALLNQAFAARYGNTVFLLQGGYQNGSETGNRGDTGGYGRTRTMKDPASYQVGNFLGKVRHYFAGGHRIGLTGEWYDRNYNEETKTSETTATDRYYTRSENQRSRVSANYDYQADSPTALFSEAHFLAYWQSIKTDTDITNRDSANASTYTHEHLSLPVQSYGVTGSATNNIFTGPLHHKITYGGEVFLTDTYQTQTGQQAVSSPYLHDNFSDMPKVHGTDMGAIVQDRIGIGRNEWFHITPGFRFDYFQRDPHNTTSYMANAGYSGLPHGAHGSHFSPKVLVEARVAHNLTLYGQYSEAYRAPSATEEYLNYSTPPYYQVTGNPNLKPESSRGWEVGMKYGNSERGANISFYDNHYHNFIDMEGVSGCSGYYLCYGYTNLAHVRIYGVEASVNWAFDRHWHTWGSFAYADGRDTDMNFHLSSVAPFRGIIGFGYKTDNWGTDLSGTFATSRDDAKYLTTTGSLQNQWKTPGYVIFDLTGWYSPTFYRPLRIQAGMYNIFDKAYYNAASLPYGQSSSSLSERYYTQPGRSFKVTARIEF